MSPKTALTRIVLDCLKPHQPAIHAVASDMMDISGISYIDIDTVEVDSETESIKVTIHGVNLDYNAIEKKLNEVGVVVHSIDKVIAGKFTN